MVWTEDESYMHVYVISIARDDLQLTTHSSWLKARARCRRGLTALMPMPWKKRRTWTGYPPTRHRLASASHQTAWTGATPVPWRATAHVEATDADADDWNNSDVDHDDKVHDNETWRATAHVQATDAEADDWTNSHVQHHAETMHEELDDDDAHDDHTWRATSHVEASDADADDWNNSDVQHHAETMYKEVMDRIEWTIYKEVLWKGPGTTPPRKMSYSASIKALEVALRGLVHTAFQANGLSGARPLEQLAAIGVQPPDVLQEVQRRAALVRGLFQCIRTKTSGSAYTKTRQEHIVKLMEKVLEENLKRCAWDYVAEMGSDIQNFACTKTHHCADIARETLEELLANSPGRDASCNHVR